MKILVACEFSGVVREAFKALGHNAWSCDLEPTEIPGQHVVGDVREILGKGWDLMIAHPPCTHLSASGAKHWSKKRDDNRQQEAIDFFMTIVSAPIQRICVENPVGIMSSKYDRPTQKIQPWQFGEPVSKLTCLWLKNLSKLRPTNIVPEYMVQPLIHTMSPSLTRAKDRSRTFQGIADAMANQWGSL